MNNYVTAGPVKPVEHIEPSSPVASVGYAEPEIKQTPGKETLTEAQSAVDNGAKTTYDSSVQGYRNNLFNRDSSEFLKYMSQQFPMWSNFASANGMSAQDTLDASRRADAFNNKLRWNNANAGLVTHNGLQGGTINPYRRDTISTAEMRQQRVNEQAQQQALQGATDIQTAISRLPVEVQKQIEQNNINFASHLGMTENQFNYELKRMYADINYNLPARQVLQQLNTRWMSFFQRSMSTKDAQVITQAMSTNRTLGSYLDKLLTGNNTDLEQFMTGKVLDDILNDPSFSSLTPTQQMYAMYATMNNLAVMSARSSIEASKTFFKDTAGGLTDMTGNIANMVKGGNW